MEGPTFHIQWHISNRCNLCCIHCYQEQFTSKNELCWKRLQIICDNLISTMQRWNKKLSLTLTGGEPFLKSELWQIIEYLGQSEYIDTVKIITNGMLIDKYISNIVRYPKLKEILVSIDGVTAESNDSIRGVGVFNTVIENIKLLNSYQVPITIMFTLLNHNLQDAYLLFDFAKTLSVDGYIIERFIPLGQGERLIDEVVPGEKMDELYQHISNQCQEIYLSEEMIKYRAMSIKFGKEVELYGGECIVGRDGLAILPQGDILPCRRFNLVIGNGLDESLSEIWANSQILNNLRCKENLKGKCGVCPITDCYGCRAMTFALTGDYLLEDPHCWLKFE